MELETQKILDNDLKKGFGYISHRTGQLRYSDKQDIEQWLQPVSTYKALEVIKRGQPVSVATSEEFEVYAKKLAYKEGPKGYVTNTTAIKGADNISITGGNGDTLSVGQFVYFSSSPDVQYTITEVDDGAITVSPSFEKDMEKNDSLNVFIFDKEYYESLMNDPDSYIVLTNTQTHKKCIGLAEQPAQPGDMIHVQPFGKFVFDENYETNKEAALVDHTNTEYNPHFTYEDVGKKVYVKYPNTDSQVIGNGYLTVDEEEVFKYYHNIICLGYLTDAPIYKDNVALSTQTVIEISIQGDDRGPLDSTQFEGTLGEDVYIPSNDRIRVFALGQEYDTAFKYRLRFTPQGKDNFNTTDFIAIQKMDGKTAYICFSDNFTLDSIDIQEDKFYVYLGKVYDKETNNSPKIIYLPNLKDYRNKELINDGLEMLKNALVEAFEYVSGFKCKEPIIKVPTENTEFYGTIDIESNEIGGYFEVYRSVNVKKHFADSYTYSNGSYENHGKIVLADIRIGARRNLIGIYNGAKFGLLPKGYKTVFMRQGEYTLPNENTQVFGLGDPMYLGAKGTVTKTPYNQYDFISRVCTLKEENKLLVDVTQPLAKYNGDLPAGYMKPSIYDGNGGYHAEFGFVLMDGKTSYGINDDTYKLLYERLCGWYDMTLYTDPNTNTFKVPKVVRMIPDNKSLSGQTEVYMQIKYIENGIFETVPRIPFIRKFGTFEKETALDEEEKVASIPSIDVTVLVDTGVNENGFAVPDIDSLDIHLFVDPNENYIEGDSHDWHEIKEGYFNYNNSLTYGYQWKIRRLESTDSHSPYGKYELYTDIGESRGISYVTDKNQSPKKCTGCHYKVYIARRECYMKQFDIDQVFKAYLTNNVYDDDTNTTEVQDKAVTGKAVLDAIENRYRVTRLVSREGALIEFGSLDNINGNIINPTDDLQFVSNTVLPLVSPRITISNSPDRTINNEYSAKFVFENGIAKIEGAELESILKTVLNKAGDGNEYVVRDNTYATIGQVRNHSDITIDNKRYVNNYTNKTGETGLVHGMIFGYNGNVNASKLEGVGIRTTGIQDIGQNLTRESGHDPYIPFRRYDSALKEYVSTNEGYTRHYSDPDSNNDQKIFALSGIDYEQDIKTVVKRNFYVENTVNTVEDYIKVSSLTSDPEGKAITIFKTVYNINEKQIEFYNNPNGSLESLANLKAGGFYAGSRSKYKRIYGETYRAYKKYIEQVDEGGSSDNVTELIDCNFTVLDKNSIKYNETNNAFKYLLGSALQAAYEMPLAYWQYNTDKEWYKKYFGLIIERVEDVASFISPATKRSLFTNEELEDENNTIDYKDNEFNYTEAESNSIREYLTNIIDNSSSSQNILSTVGLLLKASQETQERLLKLEASTFGDDADTIPGARQKKIFTGLPTVSPAPTNYGLNRLIRAICLEIYNTANPFDTDVYEGSKDTTSSLSRIDHLIWSLEGKENDSNKTQTKVAENTILKIDASTYPYPDTIDEAWENRHAEFHQTELEYQSDTGKNVYTRVNAYKVPNEKDLEFTEDTSWLWEKDKDGNYIHTHIFNGVNDAIIRITSKLNALTYSIHNDDNICSEPVRLNTIRQNIEHIIRETYFDNKYVIEKVDIDGSGSSFTYDRIDAVEYHDVNGEPHAPYLKDVSRFDKLTNDLYNYTITTKGMEHELEGTNMFGNETSEHTKDTEGNQQQVYITNRLFNGKSLLIDYKTDVYSTNYEGEAIVETAKLHVPQNLNDYEYATIIDIIIDAIGSQYFRKVHNEYNSNHKVVDWEKTSTSQKDDELKLQTYKETRLNRTITERLELLESALDNVVQKLSRTPVFEKDTKASDWLKNKYSTEHSKHVREEQDNQNYFGNVYSIEEYINELNAWLGYSQDKGGKYSLEETELTHSYKNTWERGLKNNTVGTSAEWAVDNQKRMFAAIEDILYRLQEEEKKTTRLNAILGNEFDTNVKETTTTAQTGSWDETHNSETDKVQVFSKSSYNISDDIKDLLLTIYGADKPNDDIPTDYVHRSWIDNGTHTTQNVRFALAGTSNIDGHNYVYRNIIDDFLHEMYYNPQSYILEPFNNNGIIDYTYELARNDVEHDSRRAVVYDFDMGQNLYDVPDGEVALSYNNRKEFFNNIQSTNTDTAFISNLNTKYEGNNAHPRQSRFDILEEEIRHLRKLLGVNYTLDTNTLGFPYSQNKSDEDSENARKLKYKGELSFKVTTREEDSESYITSFNSMKFFSNPLFDSNNPSDLSPENFDQYNISGSTNILSFLLNNDKASRLLRTELGYHKSLGFKQYYDPESRTIQNQPAKFEDRIDIYERLKRIEDEFITDDKFDATIKDTSNGTGNIYDIVNYLGNYTWYTNNKGYVGSFGSLDADTCKIGDRTNKVSYNSVTEELSKHNSHLETIYSEVGIDTNADKVDEFYISNAANVDGKEKKHTLWGRINALEVLNENDLDRENILTATYEKGKVITQFLKHDDKVDTVRTIQNHVSVFNHEGTRIFYATISEGTTYTFTYEGHILKVVYTDDKAILTCEDDLDVSKFNVDVTYGDGNIIAATSYVNSVVEKTKDDLLNKYGEKTNHTIRSVSNLTEKEVYGTVKPITVVGYSESINNIPSYEYTPTEVSFSNLVSSINSVIINQQIEINNLQDKLSKLSNHIGTTYDSIDKIDNLNKVRTTSSLLKFN